MEEGIEESLPEEQVATNKKEDKALKPINMQELTNRIHMSDKNPTGRRAETRLYEGPHKRNSSPTWRKLKGIIFTKLTITY